MSDVVLDSSAVIAVLANEPGAEHVRGRAGRICAVNYAEVVGRLTEWGVDEVGLDLAMRQMRLAVVAFEAGRAYVAGRLRRDPVARQLSLGDRACLSLALQTGLPVLTADRAWSELEIGVDVRLIR